MKRWNRNFLRYFRFSQELNLSPRIPGCSLSKYNKFCWYTGITGSIARHFPELRQIFITHPIKLKLGSILKS